MVVESPDATVVFMNFANLFTCAKYTESKMSIPSNSKAIERWFALFITHEMVGSDRGSS